MKGKLLFVLSLVTAFMFSGCSGQGEEEPQVSPKDQQAIMSVVRANVDAAENEDLNAFMQTLHPDSPLFDSSRKFMQAVFQKYDLSYQVVESTVEEVSGDVARVSFTQITRKRSGPPGIKDNKVKGEHILKKSDGNWKIYRTKAGNYTELING